MKRAFGRGFAADDRDHPIRRKRSARTSRYWNDSRWHGNQKSTPHCVGFAWAHWLHAAPICNWVDPDGIYSLAKYLDEWQGEDYDGTSVRAGAKVLHRLGLIEEYQFTRDVKTLTSTLLEVGPVVIGVNWYQGMNRTDADGLIHPTGRLQGGHAVLLSGVNTKTGLVRGKNSWSQAWGNDGRFLITLDDMARLLSEDGECCVALERKGVPR